MGGNSVVSVITPSVRPEMLEILAKCLKRQTLKDFEWIVVAPPDLFIPIDREIGHDYDFKFIDEPPKREGDYYGLNKAWNAGFKEMKGELCLSIQDGIWFPPDFLERFWFHYQANPRACVGAVGDQYDAIQDGKPEHCVWRDPRKRTDLGSFYEIEPRDLEFSVASLPSQAIREVGGVDEEFDKYAALSEKEMCDRIDKKGYNFYLDQSLEYRAIKHPRLNEEWDKRYNAGYEYYLKCLQSR